MTALNLDVFFRDRGAAKGLDDLSKKAAGVAKASEALNAANKKLSDSERRVADAVGAVRVAEAKVQELRTKQNATAAQRIKAEENLAKATRNLSAAEKDLEAAGKSSLAVQQKSADVSDKLAKRQDALRSTSRGLAIIGGAVAAGIGVAVKATANFDAAMSKVAATGEDAKNNINGLRQAALQAGKDTKFSATEAAAGIENLAKAGVSAKDAMGGGLAGALNLAAAGNLNVADSAELAATAMTQFKLQGKDIPHVADLMAAAAGKAQGDVSDMAFALKQSGLVAAQFGLSIEETTGGLAAFASAGLLGSDAGTSFRTMLLHLANPSEKAAGLMDELGINAYDAQGNFVGLANLAGQLQKQLGGLSQSQRDAALATIFGSDAIRGANVLYQQGSVGIAKWTHDVNDSGFAARQAAEKMNNLRGDLEFLRGSFETALIGLGSSSNSVLRPFVRNITAAVDAFNELGDTGKSVVLGIGGTVAVMALSAAAMIKLASAANSAKEAFQALGITAKGASIATAGIGAALGLAGLAFAHFASASAESKSRVDDFTLALKSQNEELQKNVRAVAAKQLQDAGAFDAARVLGIGLEDVTSAALGQQDALNRINPLLEAYVQAGLNSADVDAIARVNAANDLTSAIGRTGGEYNKAVTEAKQMEEATKGNADAASAATGKFHASSGGISAIGQAAKESKKQLKEMTAAMFDSARAALELQGTEDGVQAAIDDATKAVKDNGRTFDSNTEKGRNNRAALRSLAEASIAYREKLIEQGAKQRTVTRTTDEARTAFIKTAEKMGVSRKRAEDLADKFGLLDKKINALNDKNVNTRLSFSAQMDKYKISIGRQLGHKAGQIFAEGGYTGRGAKYEPAGVVHKGEVVWDQEAVKKAGGPKVVDSWRMAVKGGSHSGYAGGGVVNPSISSPRFPHHNPTANLIRNTIGGNIQRLVADGVRKHLDELLPASFGANLPGGGKPSGRGMGALFSYARRLGMGHSTYPGHGEKGMNKAWDFSPVSGGRGNQLAGHAWANARNYGIWYVIWNRRIASRTRPGAGWRPYTRYGANASPSQAHTNHVHVSWYDKGGLLKHGGMAVNTSGQPERVLAPRDTQNFERLVDSMRGSGGAGNTYIEINAPNYVGSQEDLRRTLVDMNRRGQLEVIKR